MIYFYFLITMTYKEDDLSQVGFSGRTIGSSSRPRSGSPTWARIAARTASRSRTARDQVLAPASPSAAGGATGLPTTTGIAPGRGNHEPSRSIERVPRIG